MHICGQLIMFHDVPFADNMEVYSRARQELFVLAKTLSQTREPTAIGTVA